MAQGRRSGPSRHSRPVLDSQRSRPTDARRHSWTAATSTGSVPQLYVSNLDGTDRVRLTSIKCPPDSDQCDFGSTTSTPILLSGRRFPTIRRRSSQTTPPDKAGTNGWFVGDVTVDWSVTDPESNVATSSGCDSTNITSDTAALALTCTAKNRWHAWTEQVQIKRDATRPAITYANNVGTYALDQTIAITCLATDRTPGSGLAFTTCSAIKGSGSSFGLGPQTPQPPPTRQETPLPLQPASRSNDRCSERSPSNPAYIRILPAWQKRSQPKRKQTAPSQVSPFTSINAQPHSANPQESTPAKATTLARCSPRPH